MFRMYPIRPIFRSTLCIPLDYPPIHSVYPIRPVLRSSFFSDVMRRLMAIGARRCSNSVVVLASRVFFVDNHDVVPKRWSAITQWRGATSQKNEDVQSNRSLLDVQKVQEMLRSTGRRSESIIRTLLRKYRSSPWRTDTVLRVVGP
jgi:hypothetical protein